MRLFLHSVSSLVLVLAAPMVAAAMTSIDWTTTPPISGEIVGDEVHISGVGTHLLVVIEDPVIASDSYAVRGSVRYQDVAGPGYLEMWSHFSDGGAYFSRTLAAEGPLAALAGSSAGRNFELPFFLDEAPPPERIEINVVLPRGGEVWVGPLTLDDVGDSGAWWTPQQGGIVGALAGTILGLAGAVVGILATRGRNGRLVRSILKVGLGLGTVILVAGTGALAIGQPGHVWAPLLIIGGIAASVSGTLLPAVSKRLAEAELHRIHALDSSPH